MVTQEKENMEKLKNLGIRVDPAIHQKLKLSALKQNLTLKELLTHIVTEYLKKSGQ